MKLIKHAQSVEVPTDSTSKQRFYFSEQPILRGKRVISVIAQQVGVTSKSPISGKAVVNATVFNKSFLVLVSENREVINRIPLLNLTTIYSEHLLSVDRVIDWPKSYVEVGSVASLDATETFLFTFYCADRIRERVPAGTGLNMEIVEVKTTPATIMRFELPDNEILRGKQIHSIEYVYASVSMTPSGASLVNSTALAKSFLTIQSGGKDIFRQVSLNDLIPNNFGGLRIPVSVIPDLPNSFIECTDTTDLVADEIYLLYFYYWDKIIRRQ